MTRRDDVCCDFAARPAADPVAAAARDVVDAAVLWVADQQCASALAELEGAVERLLGARRARRAVPAAEEGS